jgi:hypothetical protein
MTTTEGNKLIAKFMGIGKLDDNIYAIFIPEISCETLFLPAEDLLFNDRWDWLMPVVKRCRDIDHYQAHTHYKPIAAMLGTLDILNVHSTVVEFIQWYNNK